MPRPIRYANEPPPPPDYTLHKALIALVFLAVLGAGVWFAARWWLSETDRQSGSSYAGSVNLSLSPLEEGDRGRIQLYALDLTTRSLARREVPNGERAHALQGVISPDGTKIAYILHPQLVFAGESAESQVYVADVQPDGSLANARALTNFQGAKRNPSWSPDGSRIAFNAETGPSGARLPETAGAGAGQLVLPSHYGIYVVTLEGELTPLMRGLYPHWSPDGEYVMYLSDDGFYIAYVSTARTRKVLPILNGTGHATMQFDVSPDGRTVAVPNATNGYVALWTIESWRDGVLTSGPRIPVGAFWPHFSPDGRHLVLEVVRPNDQGDITTDYTLALYEIETGTLEEDILSLRPYRQDSLWVDGWTR